MTESSQSRAAENEYEFRVEVLERLTRLETQIETLCGRSERNLVRLGAVETKVAKVEVQMESLCGVAGANTGRLGTLEGKVSRHERLLWMFIGAGLLVAWLIELARSVISARR